MIEFIERKITERAGDSPLPIIAAAVYGSWARGTQTPDSDFDILIISDKINPRKHKRGSEIAEIKEWLSSGQPMDILLLTPAECLSNFRNHNPLFLDIAWEGVILTDKNGFLKDLIEETRDYTRRGRLEKLHDGWRFPVAYREATLLSDVSNRDFAVVMLTDGERDFRIGAYLIREGFYDKAVYHFQQAVEKSIKSVLISFGEFKKSHFIGAFLIEKLREVTLDEEWKENLTMAARISEEIEPEVTWSRYPGIDSGALWVPYQEYTLDDAQEVKDKSEKALKVAKDFIRWWFRNDEK